MERNEHFLPLQGGQESLCLGVIHELRRTEKEDKPTVLFVDGNQGWIYLYHAEFGSEYDVEVVRNGKEALSRFQRGGIDAVVTEINLAGMDGMILLQELMRADPDAKVIIHTGSSAYKENLDTWGAREYVVKSNDQAELRRAIVRVIGDYKTLDLNPS